MPVEILSAKFYRPGNRLLILAWQDRIIDLNLFSKPPTFLLPCQDLAKYESSHSP